MPKKSSTKRRIPRRRRATRPRRKTTNKGFKVTQQFTQNPSHPKPQVFKKTTINAIVVNGTGVPYFTLGGAFASSMPDWTNIIALYNRYKMLKVTYTFNCQASAGGPISAIDMPRIWIRYNYDPVLAAAGVKDKLQECPNTKVFQFTPEKTTFRYSYYPRCIEPVVLSGTSLGTKLAKQQYIDCNFGNVQHYGIMYWMDYLAAGCQISYDISWETAFKYET